MANWGGSRSWGSTAWGSRGRKSGASEHKEGASEHDKEGASEHDQWEMWFGVTNIGLKGNAINGQTFHRKHRQTLLRVFTEVLQGQAGQAKETCGGLFVVEVGSLSDKCSPEGQARIEETIVDVFTGAGLTGQGLPQIFWDGTCVASFTAHIAVTELDPIVHMPRVAPWRRAQRFIIQGASEHNHWVDRAL